VTASLDALYAVSLAKIADGQAKTDGIAVGALAAEAMRLDRIGDGRTGTRTWVIGSDPGEWRLVPPGNGNAFGYVGEVRPFALKSSGQFKVKDDPALTSPTYTKEFNEVKRLGAQTGSARTAAQTALANWIVVNPFGPVNKALRDIATARHLTTAQEARLFALTSLASADSMIDCFNNKSTYSSWRPQTAIREAATDGNPATVADPSWLSLFPTPPYPDNPSGYNCFAAANMHAAKAFFGTDNVSFSITNPSATRSYTRFTAYVADAIEGRILIGFHFRHADENGAWLGKKVAQWVAGHEFQAVP
jgi:hypothetical protein